MTENRFTARFDGAAAFADLDNETRNRIGSLALELALAWAGQDAYDALEECRPFQAADSVLIGALFDAVGTAIPDVIDADPLPVPSGLGQVCRRCGCSEYDACFPPCSWAEPDLCSTCVLDSKVQDQER